MTIYEQITSQILAALENGTNGWQELWDKSIDTGNPHNLLTGKDYSGVNVMMLWVTAWMRGYGSNEWLTFKQAAAMNGRIRRGEKGTACVFFRKVDLPKKSDEERDRTRSIAKGFFVFNREQIDGLPPSELKAKTFDPLADGEAILNASHANIKHGGNEAYYRASTDTIQLPCKASFSAAENYYAVALHELTHWTGHSTRLDRTRGERFGDEAYAFEELVAELGAAFLCARLKLKGRLENHADYIASWVKILKTDTRAVLTAASQAEKAANFVLGFQA